MVRIFIFNWNTESISLGEHVDQNTLDHNRNSWYRRYSSVAPDFFDDIIARATKANENDEEKDVIVFSFQEGRWPGDYFHTELLPSRMPEMGYSLLKTTTMMGLGITSYKNLFNFDPMIRGLVTSIYVKTNLYLASSAETAEYCTASLTRGKGGLAIYVKINNTKFTLINSHLPFNSQSLIDAKRNADPMVRQNEVNKTNIYFNEIVKALIKDSPVIMMGDFNYRCFSLKYSAADIALNLLRENISCLSSTDSPNSDSRFPIYRSYDDIEIHRISHSNDHKCGSYNSRDCFSPCNMRKGSFSDQQLGTVINDSDDKGKEQEEKDYHNTYKSTIDLLIEECDEFRDQMKKDSIYPFKEGIEDEGPRFLPTCKMIKDRRCPIFIPQKSEIPLVPGRPLTKEQRGDTYWNIGKWNARFPSWCDRIVYTKGITCDEYYSYDNSNAIRKTDHSAIVGSYVVPWVNKQ